MATVVVQARLHVYFAAPWGGPLWMRDFGFRVANIQSGFDLYRPQRQQRRGAGYGRTHKHRDHRLDLECVSLGQEYTPQVSPFSRISRAYVFELSGLN